MVPLQVLGGRGSSMLVRVDQEPDALYVYKGLSSRLFLESTNDFSSERDAFYHEFRTVCSMTRHPNIVIPPATVVLADKINAGPQEFFCGTLYPYMKNGSLQELIDGNQAKRTRLSLKYKAKWCYKMALALSHTHFTAHGFHMDFKPSNLFLDDNGDLILIDWEQCGASPSFLAPEANGMWDVGGEATVTTCDGVAGRKRSILVYRKYRGPPRANLWSYGAGRNGMFSPSGKKIVHVPLKQQGRSAWEGVNGHSFNRCRRRARVRIGAIMPPQNR